MSASAQPHLSARVHPSLRPDVPARRVRALLASAGLVVAGLVAPAAPAAAAPIDLPPGEACPGFAVRLDAGTSDRRTRTFTDRDGNQAVVMTGAAEDVRLTNLDTGESVLLPSRGSRTLATTRPDGVTTYVYSGTLLLILFSTDVGGAGLGPSSTTLVSGRTVFTVAPDGVYTVQQVSGKTTDVCALLAP